MVFTVLFVKRRNQKSRQAPKPYKSANLLNKLEKLICIQADITAHLNTNIYPPTHHSAPCRIVSECNLFALLHIGRKDPWQLECHLESSEIHFLVHALLCLLYNVVYKILNIHYFHLFYFSSNLKNKRTYTYVSLYLPKDIAPHFCLAVHLISNGLCRDFTSYTLSPSSSSSSASICSKRPPSTLSALSAM